MPVTEGKTKFMITSSTWAKMERTFPRVRQKSIIKKYQKKARLSRNADILIFLDYILFLKRLAAEASIKALEEGERTLKSNHVNTVFKNVLKSCKGWRWFVTINLNSKEDYKKSLHASIMIMILRTFWISIKSHRWHVFLVKFGSHKIGFCSPC